MKIVITIQQHAPIYGMSNEGPRRNTVNFIYSLKFDGVNVLVN